MFRLRRSATSTTCAYSSDYGLHSAAEAGGTYSRLTLAIALERTSYGTLFKSFWITALAVLLGLLMLRGPQTAGELRLNAERWYRFADISSVEGFLEELQDRSEAKGGPLTIKLPRAPGAREQRWAHLLCGPVDLETLATGGATSGGTGTVAGLTDRVTHLEAELAQLQQTVRALCAELGVSQPGQS